MVKCPRCSSDNVQVQAKEYKPKLTVSVGLTLGGFGLIFLGVVGAILGFLIGLIVGAIISAALPTAYESVMVCQTCGYTGKIDTTSRTQTVDRMVSDGNCNLLLVRDNMNYGSLVIIQIRIDFSKNVELGNNDIVPIKLEPGNHRVFYSQKNGMGKKNREGSIDISVDDAVKILKFTLTKNGVDVALT